MAVTAGIAIGTGVAAGAGATAAAIRAARQKANPRAQQYGGSQDALDAYRSQYAGGIDKGSGLVDRSAASSSFATQAIQDVRRRALQLASTGGGIQAPTVTTEGRQILAGYQPGAASEAAARGMIDANNRALLSTGRLGGALGLRDALYASSQGAQQASSAIAAQRAQEEEAFLQAQVGQANADRDAKMAASQWAQQQRLAAITQGLQVAGQANAHEAGVAGNLGQIGLNQQGQYLDAQRNVEDAQFAADIEYDKRRQQEAQRRSDRLWQFAGGLINIAGAGLTSGFSGGGGDGPAIGEQDEFGVTNWGGRK
jgi:hypothetical protein